MLEEKFERISCWLKGKPAPPWSLQLQLSNFCNLSCIFCCRRFEKVENDRIDDQRLLKMIDEASELGVKRVALNGRAGEPLMRSVAIMLMEKIKEYGIWGDLITNGTLIEPLAKKLVEIKWDNVVCSVDGPNARIHDYLRGKKGTLNAVVKGVQEINKWKKKLKSEKPTIKFLTVVTSLTVNKIDAMIKFLHRMGGNALEIRPMIIHDKSEGKLENLKVKDDQVKILEKSIRKAQSLAKKFNVELIMEHSLQTILKYVKKGYERKMLKKYEDVESDKAKQKLKIKSLKCLFPFFEITVFPEGTASPCCIIWKQPENFKQKIVENVLKKSLEEIWFGKCFNSYREKILKEELPAWCSGCQL